MFYFTENVKFGRIQTQVWCIVFFCDIHELYSEILTRYQLKTTLESPTFTCKWTF